MTDLLLTSHDSEPPAGTTVLDDCGKEWTRIPGVEPCGWLMEPNFDGDPESWTKVAGNYGPVRVLRSPTPPPSPEREEKEIDRG